MAATNVQAFSGDVTISSNLVVDTNTLFVDSVGNKVGIGTGSPLSSTKLETRGNVLFDLSKGDTIPTGLYNYMSTQLLIDTAVYLSRGTTTASTDIDPPPGVAGDVICKFINSYSGEAVAQGIPIGMPVTTGDTIYFGGWYYAPSTTIVVQHFAGGGAGPNVNYAVGANGVWQWIERTVTATSTATTDYRIDNDTPGGTIYITGLTVRKNPSQTTNLPFTPRYSPHDGIGSVFTTQNIVAKEAAIRTLTGSVVISNALYVPDYIHHVGDDNSLFGFSGDDTFKIQTAGADRLNVNSGGSVTVGVNMFIPDYIHHVGDSDTLFGFSGADTFKITTAGVDRLTVNSAGNVDIGVNLVIPDYIYHSGDTNTYFGFNGADSIVFVTGGTTRLTINNNGTTFQNGGTALNYFREETGPAWGAVGQNGTGFNINGSVKYSRVGNFVSMMATKCQFYAYGNFYMRHTIPAQFRPNNASNSLGTSDILPWVTRVTTNSSFEAMAYCQNDYIYHVGHYNGSHFAAGSGTQHTFDAHQAVWTV